MNASKLSQKASDNRKSRWLLHLSKRSEIWNSNQILLCQRVDYGTLTVSLINVFPLTKPFVVGCGKTNKWRIALNLLHVIACS